MMTTAAPMRAMRPARFAGMAGLCLAAVVLAAAPAEAARQKKLTVAEAAEAVRSRVATLGSSMSAGPDAIDTRRFAFTAPGRAAPQRLATIERSFRFTPSGSSSGKALALGVTSRVVAPALAATGPASARAAAAPVETALAPAGYNFDLSVGWRGFSVTGGVSRLDQGLGLGRRDGVDVGLGYRANRWRAGLQATAERGATAPLDPTRLSMAQLEPRYAFEASGAYLLTPGVALNGGVRYRLSPVNPALRTPDDGAVFVGGTLAF